MSEEIVVRGGDPKSKGGKKDTMDKSSETTTAGEVTSLSVFVGYVKSLGPRAGREVSEVARGYPGSKVRAVKRKHFDESGARLKANPQDGQPNHYLMSGISVEDAVSLFATHGQLYDMEDLPALKSGETGRKGKKDL